MKIALGADHGGFGLKNSVLKYLQEAGFETVDCGTNSADSVDYPDFAKLVGAKVAGGECDFGVLVCTTGIGISIAANKIKGIRAALCHNCDGAKFSRLHNNANVICMGAKYVGKKLANEMVKTFLETQFEGGRHARRVGKLEA
ncbi:MAG: ribose 5-phosphate isomerase B [Opitutales bacterium]|nr:ribose 5-phosphate isomerase B [Opitutales bacterium]